MPAVECPYDSCAYKTPDLGDAIVAALITTHAQTHLQQPVRQLPSAPQTHNVPEKQRPPKFDRPSVSRNTSEEDWLTFTKKWTLFKRGTDIPASQVTTHLWQCCTNDLETDLFKDIPDLTTITENNLLQSIKRLAVISVPKSVRRTELLSSNQDHGQPIRSWAAQIKGKAQTCGFERTFTCNNCDPPTNHKVDYSDDLIKYILIKGIVNGEIKKEILSQPDLDEKSLPETITLIENKEMAVRAINTNRDSSSPDISNAAITAYKLQKDNQSKLSIKAKCADCKIQFNKYTLRKDRRTGRQMLKEFTQCVDCWRKEKGVKPYQNKDNNDALFDVVSQYAIHNVSEEAEVAPSTEGIPRVAAVDTTNQITLDHYLFDGTDGWKKAESKQQPTVELTMSINTSDYEQLELSSHPIMAVPTTVIAITDTGAQSSLMGLEMFLSCGLTADSLLPVKRKMCAANNEGINILGALFVRLSGADRHGNIIECAEMVYVSDSTSVFYLSRSGMEQLRIIGPNFPQIGAAAQAAMSTFHEPNHTTDTAPCGCPLRQQPPPRPSRLPFDPSPENNQHMKDYLLHRFAASTFNVCPHQPLPMMSGPPVQVHTDPTAKPVAIHTPAPIPIHWQKECKEQLDMDVALGVIEKVGPDKPTQWLMRALWGRKQDGKPRRYVDFQPLNKHSSRPTHPMIPPFRLARSIPSQTWKSVTDAWNGYHSVPIRKEDRDLFSFLCEYGRYRYCVTPQGYIASGDYYNQRYDEITADVARIVKCVDDATLWDENLEEHWWRMLDYLELVGKNGIILNPSKFQFAEQTIAFAGFIVTPTEVKPMDKYIQSIRSFDCPKNIADVRAWFGLVNQVKYYGKVAPIMEPFRHLLSPKIPFKWSEDLEQSFQQSKMDIIDAINEGVQIFDPTRKTSLSTDWSRKGIGYWLRQKYCSCESETPNCCPDGWKVTLAGSRFLRGAESRYAPIEGEALAIAWALADTKFFTMGCDDLVVATDHKPLLGIFNDRALDEIVNDRLFSLKQQTLKWRFKIVHVPGKSAAAADTLSRYPSYSTVQEDLDDEMESCVIASVKESNKVSATTWEVIQRETDVDSDMHLLRETVIEGFPDKVNVLPAHIKPFWRYRYQLSVVDGVVMYGRRIVIPLRIRKKICENLHSAHQGVTGMLQRAKISVFWPGITNSVADTRNSCELCWQIAPSQRDLPPIQPIVPSIPFEAVASDYCQVSGYHYLIIVDRFSNWPEIIKVNPGSSTSGATGLIKALRRNFAIFGVPVELSSDGGPEFSAAETEEFLKRWGVKHRKSSAYHPQSNGRAEVAVKSVKRLLHDTVSTMGDIDTDSYTRAILQLRNTPDPSTELSPSQIIFGRQIRDVMPVKPRSQVFDHPLVKPEWKDIWEKRETTLQERAQHQVEKLSRGTKTLPLLHPGDICRVQNQTGRFPRRWDRSGQIIKQGGHNQYVVKLSGSNRLSLRNRKYLRKIMTPPTHVHVYPDNSSGGNQGREEQVEVTPSPVHPPELPTIPRDDTVDEHQQHTTNDADEHPSEASHQDHEGLQNHTNEHTIVENNHRNDIDNMPQNRPQRSRAKPSWHLDYEMGAFTNS